MIDDLPAACSDVLEVGAFCHVAVSTPTGPHVTPMVFVVSGSSLWVTTSRGSVKARAWRRHGEVAGSVRARGRAVSFTGIATTYDALDPVSWPRSLANGPAIASASVRFTRKNARFFAGYAVDAHHVPLAWTPPGRVFVELRVERLALIESGRVVRTWGPWHAAATGAERFRASRRRVEPFEGAPSDVSEQLGRNGFGALALDTDDGPVVLPASWLAEGGSTYAVVGADEAALCSCGPSAPAALCIDRPSAWRAREMVGAMVRGDGELVVVRDLASGATSATRIVREAGVAAKDAAIVRVRPRTLVWWRGWSSGTVASAPTSTTSRDGGAAAAAASSDGGGA